jgi:hypothetical protein
VNAYHLVDDLAVLDRAAAQAASSISGLLCAAGRLVRRKRRRKMRVKPCVSIA